MQTIFHADDFGINLDQSMLILSCSEGCGGKGPLNSTSILVGSPNASECAELIYPFVTSGKIRIGLHLNLVEGPSCAPNELVRDLVDERGMFKISFGALLFATMAPGHEKLCKQIRVEIDAQIEKFLELFPEEKQHLRIDSHQHFHLIPQVFESLLRSIEDHGCILEYMRIPAEPRKPYKVEEEVKKQCPSINLVKNLLLNKLWHSNAKAIYDHFHMTPEEFVSRKSATFYGLMLSGRMEYSAMPSVIDAFEAESLRRSSATEVLFHPGGVQVANACLDPELSDFVSFYLSSHRELERHALSSIDFRPYLPLVAHTDK